ncbi:MAG TPA: Hpt domain-containing protein [Steroidobacteraceae bacterium]|jgi:chemosensory pili system protein ChpA (sensor histidine kinase/response regulator)
MPEVASQTLDFVGRELNVTLADARTALENYVEQQGNASLLERCTQELHRVQGVLRVLEIYGAALLAEEMEQVAAYLLATAAENKNQAESLDALMRAMVQLPSYLERVLAGGRDLALVLLPLLNDLRAVRGSALLSEGTLLLLNLKSDKQAAPVAAAPGEPPLTVEQWSRRLRARYQVGLIGWIRGERIEQNLDILSAVAQKLEQIATRQPVFQLWWVIGAVIEALRENGLEGGVSIKRLLGLGDREVRRLYEQGEARYAQTPPVELLNNLLYYVGRADSSGPRVTAVRASFRLSELLPVDDSIEQERENLSAPSVKLMQTVAAAIREDLSKVKDVLDIFVRRGAGQPKELAPQVDLLRKIGDTLGVLGLGELRGKIQTETERLDKIVAGTLKADDATLVEIAATLIGVEDRLDDSLVGMIRPRTEELSEPKEDNEFQQVQSAVLRECILNLARIKESISQNIGGTLDASGLDSWQELMRGMKAGLLMLGKSRAVDVIEGITNQLKRVMQPGARGLSAGFMDRLADSIVSVEYYMETLQAGRSDPWYMLDNAQACVQALELQQAPQVPSVSLDPGAFAKTVQISGTGVAFGQETDPTATAVGGPAPTMALSRTAVVAALAESADPELVKLFIEEAHEELAKIKRCFPLWDQNPLDRESLITVRRSFHTLKGSGRMVGARDLGEFAWSIENLLNRVLDNTLSRSAAILEVLREGVAALPQLITNLETGQKPTADTASIAARAHALAAGRTPGASAARAAQAESSPESTAVRTGVTPNVIAETASAPAPFSPSATVTNVGDALMAVEMDLPVEVSPPPVTAPSAPASPAAYAATVVLQHRAPIPVEVVMPPMEDAASPQEPEPVANDDVLRDIYARETSAHIATVRAYLERELSQPEPHAIPEEVYRACHTLSGSSKMAQARHGIRLAEPLDHWLRRMYSSGLGLLKQDLALLSDCMLAMEAVATHLDESTGYFVSHFELQQRIAQAESRLEQRLAVRAAPTAPVAQPPEAVAASVVPQPAVAAASAAPQFVVPVAPDAAQAEPPPEAVEEVDQGGDYDPEVAAIFTEEALELIDVSEQALTDWRTEPSSAEYRSALKRPLHTLKGGARMAGITAMGDLSHELESLVLAIDMGSIAADDAVFDLMQSSLDELARMREAVTNGRRVPPARAAINRINALLRPGSVPAEPVAPAAPPAAAPPPPPAPEFIVPVALDAAQAEPVAEAPEFVVPVAPDAGQVEAPTDEPLVGPELSRESTWLAVGAPEWPAEGAESEEIVLSGEPASDDEAQTVENVLPADVAAFLHSDEDAAHHVETGSLPTDALGSVEEAPTEEPVEPLEQTMSAAVPDGGAEWLESAATPETPAAAEPLAGPAEPVFAPREPAPVTKSVHVAFNKLIESRGDDSLAPPLPVPPGREPVAPAERQEMARVDADLLDQLLNISGEASIARSRLEQQLGSIDFNLGELSRTVIRLKEQLRSLEIETEAQILHRHEDESAHRGDFDPLELDRYSSIQQFSRALAETANDVASIQQLLENLAKDTQNLLQQQARTITELQNGLMRTRMVPFQRHVQRLARIVRQAASDTGKRAELVVEGAAGELDRQVLERMLPPFEHMLRNAVVHGIEKPEERVRKGKPETGKIVLELHREGAEVMVRLIDDGGGMNLNAIREKGAALGLIPAGQVLSDEDAMQLILEPGFSTAGTVTQQAGRGVGMDVVATEIKRLGGALHMETKAGEGTVFTIRLPFTLAISHALVVRTGEEFYALPLPTVEGVLRLSKAEVTAHLGRDANLFDYGGQKYRFQHLATFVSLEPSPLPEQDVTIPVVLVRAGEHSTGLVADELVGSREIVVKSVGPQISSIRGISGATILGDGRIVIILDIGALVRAEWRGRPQSQIVPKEKTDKRTFAMVVDDSITVRRVTQRLLERNGMRVLTARDGMDAVTLLQDNVPDIILLDIEMPRMDGYEVAAHVRNDPRLKDVPIIMITSRVGEKHRARAIELGVDDYLGKPYQEAQLLDAISPLVEKSRAARGDTGYIDLEARA